MLLLCDGFRKSDLDIDCKCFSMVDTKTQDYFLYFIHLFSIPSFRKTEEGLFLLTLKG